MFQLRQRGLALQLAQGFDKLLCLEEIAVEHYQHQIDAALRALHQMRGRALLADEVGLGKTIEAGIVMKELIQRGLVRTVLVLTPASLTEQWREELQSKFHESFTVMETPQQWQAVREADAGRWIVSLDRAKLDAHSEAVLGREYDLLIVDEAHKLKNRATRAWQFVNKVRKRYVLMLTATPVQNDLMELYSLITILSPGQLGTVRAFRRHFIEHADARHPKNAASLRRLLNDVMIRNRRSKVDIRFPKRQAAVYHLELSEPEWMLYNDVTDYIRRRFKDRDSDKHLRLTLMTLQKELSSSPQALAQTLRKMVADRAHGDNVRAELQRFLELAESIPTSRKLRAVREILARYPGKFLIFTEYRQTQEAILADLAAQGISAVAFHGGMDIHQKEAAIAAFRDGLPATIRQTDERRRYACVPCAQRPQPPKPPGSRQARGARAGQHRERGRRAQPPVLPPADQLRPALEPHARRAAHRPPAPPRPGTRRHHLQPELQRDDRGARHRPAGAQDPHVRAGHRRTRPDPRQPRGQQVV